MTAKIYQFMAMLSFFTVNAVAQVEFRLALNRSSESFINEKGSSKPIELYAIFTNNTDTPITVIEPSTENGMSFYEFSYIDNNGKKRLFKQLFTGDKNEIFLIPKRIEARQSEVVEISINDKNFNLSNVDITKIKELHVHYIFRKAIVQTHEKLGVIDPKGNNYIIDAISSCKCCK